MNYLDITSLLGEAAVPPNWDRWVPLEHGPAHSTCCVRLTCYIEFARLCLGLLPQDMLWADAMV